MDADVLAVRRWLLDEARGLQQQHKDVRRRLAVIRSLVRLVAAYEAATRPPAAEAAS